MRIPVMAFVTVAMFSQAADAQTTTLSDYEAMDAAAQSRITNDTLARLFDFHQRQGREDVANCIVDYFLSPPESGGLPRGHIDFVSAIDHIQHTEMQPDEIPSIERILFNIVTRACVSETASD